MTRPEDQAMQMNELTPPVTRPRDSLRDLEQHRGFVDRHIGTDNVDQAVMLRTLGFATRNALIDAIVPEAIRRREPLALPEAKGEEEALEELRGLAAKNRVYTSYIGQGYYGTYTPGVILRNVLENPAWYTAYTPYQPEISQGRLEALINFQTMICDLSAMAIANASMLDEATAAAEGMTLCRRMSQQQSTAIFVAADVLPQTIDVVRTRAKPLGITVVVGPAEAAADADCFAVLLQYPGADGDVRDYRALAARMHAKDSMVIAATDLLALTVLTPPGEWGADVVVGSSQRFGVPMGFGGPHAAFLATRDEAAYPPRKGHFEYLHRAGSACGAGQHVRGLPRTAGARDDRRSRASPDRDPARRPRAAWSGQRQRQLFRYANTCHRRAHQRDSRARDGSARQPAPDRHHPHRRVAG
jgi:glycine dehydrogenase